MRVKRQSDGAELDIQQLGWWALWHRGDVNRAQAVIFCQHTACDVVTIYDQVNGNNLVGSEHLWNAPTDRFAVSLGKFETK